jgi:hypothetical protein
MMALVGKCLKSESLKVRKGGLPPLTAAKFNSRILAQAFCGASEFREALFISGRRSFKLFT